LSLTKIPCNLTAFAREIAQKLQLNYIFGREFQELTRGTRHSPAYHGQATLSRWPLSNARVLRFQQQSNFWQPHWFLPQIEPFQERLGGRLALVADASVGGKTVVTYNLHLESRGDDRLRRAQIEETLKDARRYKADTAVVLAGDFNMDVSAGDVAKAIRRADFQDAFTNQRTPTTPNSFFTDGRVIDWIFSRGPLRSDTPQGPPFGIRLRSLSLISHTGLPIESVSSQIVSSLDRLGGTSASSPAQWCSRLPNPGSARKWSRQTRRAAFIYFCIHASAAEQTR
jgi:endonuclease/exonuclease/phosphatase family metal-dependent hydrolase